MTDEARAHLWNLRFLALHQALANKLYHQKCAAIFECRDRLSRLLVLIGSSAVFMALASGDVARWWALLAFAGSAASLLFSWSEKARAASEKMMQYSAIEAAIQAVGEWGYTEGQVNQWRAQLSAISEPAPNPALWARACYSADLALGAQDVKAPTFWQLHTPVLTIP